MIIFDFVMSLPFESIVAVRQTIGAAKTMCAAGLQPGVHL
jgi:hypothetical protein